MVDINVVVIIKVQSTFWIYPPPTHTHTRFFESVLRPFQYYFSSYENGQSEGGAKTGEPLEKTTWHTRKQNLACLTCGQSGARTHTRSGPVAERLRACFLIIRSSHRCDWKGSSPDLATCETSQVLLAGVQGT